MARAIRVLVDGQVVGKVGNNQQAQFALSPGRHTVQVAMDWCRCAPLELDLDENDTIPLLIAVPSMWSMDAFFGVFCWPGRVFGLTRMM